MERLKSGMGNINKASSSNVWLTHPLCYHPDAVTDFSFSCRIFLLQQTKFRSWMFGFFFLSVTNFICFRNWCWYSRNAAAGVAGVRSLKYQWRQALASAALITLDISVCCLYPAPVMLRILGSWGILPKKTSVVWPFCPYHKDVSNLLKLSRNDKALPKRLCRCKYFLHQ